MCYNYTCFYMDMIDDVVGLLTQYYHRHVSKVLSYVMLQRLWYH